jgi:hypothetical protein
MRLTCVLPCCLLALAAGVPARAGDVAPATCAGGACGASCGQSACDNGCGSGCGHRAWGIFGCGYGHGHDHGPTGYVDEYPNPYVCYFYGRALSNYQLIMPYGAALPAFAGPPPPFPPPPAVLPPAPAVPAPVPNR